MEKPLYNFSGGPVGQKVIVISNEADEPLIGTLIRFEVVGSSGTSAVPVVRTENG